MAKSFIETLRELYIEQGYRPTQAYKYAIIDWEFLQTSLRGKICFNIGRHSVEKIVQIH